MYLGGLEFLLIATRNSNICVLPHSGFSRLINLFNPIKHFVLAQKWYLCGILLYGTNKLVKSIRWACQYYNSTQLRQFHPFNYMTLHASIMVPAYLNSKKKEKLNYLRQFTEENPWLKTTKETNEEKTKLTSSLKF